MPALVATLMMPALIPDLPTPSVSSAIIRSAIAFSCGPPNAVRDFQCGEPPSCSW